MPPTNSGGLPTPSTCYQYTCISLLKMAEGPLCRAPPKPISNRSLRKEGPVVFGDGGAGRDRPPLGQ